ncbi:hypothetical protein KUTeg_002082 [Tegillarca granosa]|uniref:Rab3 GTPase-activating protein catalytic subunit n=1 Tax=Tegillarca granosa TaxID=220873 RepID=A0ABQ9FTE4_TEGGR|nr:hypothetical protein KUTeg_002082 [Tegillarca granosa]
MAADEDTDVFEITDFTTASEWERFIARLEEILHEWKLVNRIPLPPVPKNDFLTGSWLEKTDDLYFADFKFVITYHYLKSSSAENQLKEQRLSPDDEETEEHKEDIIPTVLQDMMNTENDFPPKAHCLCRWYGLQEFVCIVPSTAIDSDSRSKILLSSASIALSNACCQVPIFIQIQHQWRKMYSGISVIPGINVEFDVIHLNKPPSQYNHLAGLLDVFKAKMATQVTPRPTVSVAVRFTYVLQEWVNSPWSQAFPDISTATEDDVGYTSFWDLPFGACEDPVSELNLACTWPCLSEDMIVENQNYSDLDPLQAPQWSVKISMTENPLCLLGDCLKQFLKSQTRKETTDELLGNILSTEEDNAQAADISQALQRLTEPKVAYNIPSISNVVNKASSRLAVKPGHAPISTETLNKILLFLFPDAKDSFENEDNKEEETNEAETSDQDNKYSELLKNLDNKLKSAPVDSLVHKLALCLCIINKRKQHGGFQGLAQLWQEFVLEMRFRWENKHLIEGVKKGSPNLGTCLLNQKLQMLNCCIERKIRREQLYKGYTGDLDSPQDSPRGKLQKESSSLGTSMSSDSLNQSETSSRKNSKTEFSQENSGEKTTSVKAMSIDSSSEDEFFECDETNVENAQKSENSETATEQNDKEESMDAESETSEASLYKDSLNYKPEGRLTPCQDYKLLNSEEPMYIPVTQEPAPMTEDMLDEHAEILAKLGTSSEGAQIRARMQSASLLSDMESFKAANPGCTLLDFVRWYSPKDYVEEEFEDENGQIKIKGHLSARMLIPGNVWVEVWNTARAVPARRQKRLFDDTKEAEKKMDIKHCHVYNIAVSNLKKWSIEDSDIPRLKDLVEHLITKASKITRLSFQDIKKYEDIVGLVTYAELCIARAKSLKNKFSKDLLEKPEAEEEMDNFVSELLHQHEVPVTGGPCGPAGSIIHKLFVMAQKELHMLMDDDREFQPTDDAKNSVPDFPRPFAREYILRTMAPRPAPYSKTLPQLMFCSIVDGHEFRLAGAFSSDSTFQ